jgi:hypothetical protein
MFKQALYELTNGGYDTEALETANDPAGYTRAGAPLTYQASEDLHGRGSRSMPTEQETRLHKAAIQLATERPNLTYAQAKAQLRGY